MWSKSFKAHLFLPIKVKARVPGARSKEVLVLGKVPFPGSSNLFYLFGPGQAEQFLLSTID